MKYNIMKWLGIAAFATLALCGSARSQTPIGSGGAKPATDTAMIFEPTKPLIANAQELAREYPNSWGFNVSFSDYGFGGGMFFQHSFDPDLAALLTFDLGTAEGSREVDLLIVNKINRIFVIPVMASLQYRVFHSGLSDNLRPYITAGGGPVIAMTTPYNDEFFSAFGSAAVKIIPGGFVGVGANFGTDPKSSFGASLRYFIIPYPGALESTSTESLTNLSGLFLSVCYGFNF
jgi:hypothetical protein